MTNAGESRRAFAALFFYSSTVFSLEVFARPHDDRGDMARLTSHQKIFGDNSNFPGFVSSRASAMVLEAQQVVL
jgi:hypothetical protein